MEFDEASWKFPVENLKPKKAALCLFKQDSGEIICSGARIECEPMSLPDINEAYEKESIESPEIMVNFSFPYFSLNEIEGKTLSLGEDVEECGDDIGSVYAFAAHNPVGWQTIEFGKAEGDTIDALIDLYFDFDFEDRIGGTFRHKLPVKFELERRWEL